MTFHSGGVESGQQSPADAEAIEAILPIVEGLVSQLVDGFDHPEIWNGLAHASQFDDITTFRDLIGKLRTVASDARVAKAAHVVHGLLHALTVDRAEGIRMLTALAHKIPHCPQIAGALFFIERHGDATRSADLSDRFCDAPFIKFETLIDGTVAPCCSIWTQQRLGQLDGSDAGAIWNSPSAQAMRASILDGSYRYCNKQRCTAIMEDQLPKRDEVTDSGLRRMIDEGMTALDTGPRWLFLAHDVTCNLSCPSCRDRILAADEAQEARFDKIEQQVLRPLIDGEGRVTVSVSGQGDPWSSPHYRSILRYLADHDLDVELDLHTNALLMGEDRWSKYIGLEKYKALVNVSIDACTPWVYEAVRRPGKWEKLYPNLAFIAAKHAAGVFREYHLNATIQLDNFHEMPALVDLATSLNADSMRLYMIQNTGGHIARDYARKNVADALHPLHLAFLETLRDPKLGLPIAHLYDVALWRTRAFETRLPSDDLGEDFTREALSEALMRAAGDAARTVALCVAGRIRFPEDARLLDAEARALESLGYAEQAEYRRKEAGALQAA